MDELKVSLCRPSQICEGVSIWEWSISALDEGDEASKWFTNYVGKPSRLVCFNEESETRHVDPNYASGFRVMFSDGYPFLVVSQESLDSLNERLQEPIPINWFRPKFIYCLVRDPFVWFKNCRPFFVGALEFISGADIETGIDVAGSRWNFYQEKFGMKSMRDEEFELISALHLQVSIISQALIFVTRSRSWLFVERPGLLLLTAFFIAQLDKCAVSFLYKYMVLC
ncbi:uncharacterized protein LOC110940148 isoform X2 [Helianthus annuus]|uniref:uncharacterized protein LOC110940148 isoform X2 n=1 Tax=Helianthus annuus TaxID=4232 RepID=UPI000B8F5CD4|nr:uncharacterized protein LOC110940148 isoform X2 [Helianthus annuus]